MRDANAWAKYLNEARDRFATKADVVFAQHHWPVWGNARVLDYLAKQRDTYKYLHDQTLRLMSHGFKSARDRRAARPAQEPGERVARARLLRHASATTPRPSTSAISAGTTPTRPTSIRCPPWSAPRRPSPTWAAPTAAIARAREDFAKGEYRWVADAMSQVVFAEPDNAAARELGADALEQLGYQSESATWRNAYLQGARELRGRHDGAGRPVPCQHRHRARP